MIKVNELRLGNYLDYEFDLGVYKYSKLDNQTLRWFLEDNEDWNLRHRPVELDNEILLSCGFELKSEYLVLNVLNDYEISFNSIDFDGNSDYSGCWVLPDNEHNGVWFRTRKIKYLHELQNLYFELTGNELEINF